MNAEFVERLITDGLTSEAYQTVLEQQAALDPADFEGQEAERVQFTRLNLHRVRRLRRNWNPSAELADLVARLEGPQTWLMLTESWCGDSAQNIPCLEIVAESRPDITIRFLLRDDNLEIMDRYLTDGKRSIPLLVAFDDEGREQFRWGSRPAEAEAVIKAALAEDLDKPARLEKLHLFYGRNRGRALDAELVTLLGRYLGGAS